MTRRIIQQPSKRSYIRGSEGGKGRLQLAKGGKSSNKNPATETLSAATYLDRETFNALAHLSGDTHKSISWIIRDVIIEYLTAEGYLNGRI